MITDFIYKKLGLAQYKLLKDGTYFGEIPGLAGVWANAKTLEGCRKQLQEVLEDWLVLQLQDGQRISGVSLKRSPLTSRQVKEYA